MRAMEFVSQDISIARVEPHLVAFTQPRSAYCEQFRSLRTRVLHAGERKKMQAFVVTSSGVAEGKTLTALNLAWLLAQTDGVRALLIDSDLRQPCATDYLGIERPIGLSEVLAGEATLEETIVRLEPAGLHLLPGGLPRDDVAELLSGPKFGKVLSDVRRMFNYIIIDAPPLGIFTDATVLINRADGALLVVRSGKTRYAVVDRLLEQLPRERMLGVILNRTDEQLNESNYYYQRRYKRHENRPTPPVARTTIKDEEEVILVS
jgi:capsular exopolysaccharide synthesis family protein